MTDPDPCSCFKSVPPVQSKLGTGHDIVTCDPEWFYDDTQTSVRGCKQVFGFCKRILKLVGPYMDQCRCDCEALTTAAPGRVKRDLLLQL